MVGQLAQLMVLTIKLITVELQLVAQIQQILIHYILTLVQSLLMVELHCHLIQ
jgi:hypothetical protein